MNANHMREKEKKECSKWNHEKKKVFLQAKFIGSQLYLRKQKAKFEHLQTPQQKKNSLQLILKMLQKPTRSFLASFLPNLYFFFFPVSCFVFWCTSLSFPHKNSNTETKILAFLAFLLRATVHNWRDFCSTIVTVLFLCFIFYNSRFFFLYLGKCQALFLV